MKQETDLLSVSTMSCIDKPCVLVTPKSTRNFGYKRSYIRDESQSVVLEILHRVPHGSRALRISYTHYITHDEIVLLLSEFSMVTAE